MSSEILYRPRRLRRTAVIRNLVREQSFNLDDLIHPIFIDEGLTERQAIDSLPGICRFPESTHPHNFHAEGRKISISLQLICCIFRPFEAFFFRRRAAHPGRSGKWTSPQWPRRSIPGPPPCAGAPVPPSEAE